MVVTNLKKLYKDKLLFCNYLYFIFYMYMLSLQNIHTISEEKGKNRTAPSKGKIGEL